MKSTQMFLVAVVVLLTVGLASAWQGPETREQAAANGQTSAPTIPPRHLQIRKKLERKIRLDFEKTPVSKVLNAFSAALGEPIYFDKPSMDHIDPNLLNREVTLKTDREVTLNSAVRRLLNQIGMGGYGYSFDNGLCLISSQHAKDRYIMLSHDMSGFSDYTTAKRLRLIAQIRSQIAPTTWCKENGPWIAPSANVFAIDIYHTPKIHEQVSTLRGSVNQVALSGRDKEADGLGNSFFHALRAKDFATQTDIVTRLRELYTYKSISKRLEYERSKKLSEPVLTAASSKRLDDREARVNPKGHKYLTWTQVRGESLRRLHEEQVKDFVSREGFGLTRMPTPGPSQLRPQPVPTLPLASAEITSASGDFPVSLPKTSADQAANEFSMPSQSMLDAYHHHSQGNFLDPRSFGYVKDRDHVAGFSAHAFSYMPNWRWVDNREPYVPTEHWAVHRMQLVSLLKFDNPAVYVSANLPKMDALKDAETRALNLFEDDALSQLQNGEDVITRATTNRIEMLGSLRADSQCLECHDVKRGHLLGAFSYVLLRDPPLKLQEKLRQ